MKILYVLGTFPKLTSEAFILNEMVELVKNGHDVHIIADRKEEGKAHRAAYDFGLVDRTITPGRDYSRGLIKLADISWKIVWDGMRGPIRTARILRAIRRYIRDPWMFMDIYLGLRVIDRVEFDLVHSPFSTTKNLVKTYLISVSKRRPFTIAMRAREIYQTKESRDLAGLKELMERASAVMTISEYNRKHIGKVFGVLNVPIIRSGIDTVRFKPSGVEKIRKVMTVGRFVEKKGIEHLLRAVSMMKERGFDDLEFLIVGEGPLKDKYREMVQNLGVTGIVKIKEPMTQEELIEEMKDAMLFCLPSVVANDNDRDMLPNVIKEAMAMEIPVVTTDIPGIEELVEDHVNGMIVGQADPGQLADAIMELLGDPELRSRLGANGRRKVAADFSVVKETRKLQDIFAEAIKGQALSCSG